MATGSVSFTYPDAAIPKARLAFGGVSNAQTLAAIQAWASPRVQAMIRDEMVERNTAARVATAQTAARTAVGAVDTAAKAEGTETQAVWPA